jgi:hypothetical protein
MTMYPWYNFCLKEELILMQLRQMETSLCMMRLSLVILTSSEFSANVEAFNIDQQRTALYQAVENGHNAVAKILSGMGPTRSFTLTTARRWKTLPRARLPSLPCYDLVK